MNIKVIEKPTEYVLEGETFFCTHPNVLVDTVEVDTFNGEHSTYNSLQAYCEDCGENLSESYDFDDGSGDN